MATTPQEKKFHSYRGGRSLGSCLHFTPKKHRDRMAFQAGCKRKMLTSWQDQLQKFLTFPIKSAASHHPERKWTSSRSPNIGQLKMQTNIFVLSHSRQSFLRLQRNMSLRSTSNLLFCRNSTTGNLELSLSCVLCMRLLA